MEESSEHLLFTGDRAKVVWSFLAKVFDKRPPVSLSMLCSEWFFKAKLSSFMDNFSMGIAECALWEIWRHINHRRFEEVFRCPVRFIKRWASSTILLVKGVFKGSLKDRLALKMLDSPLPRIENCKGVWSFWQPSPSGFTLTMNLIVSEGGLFAGGVIWNHNKSFIMALRCIIPEDCLFQGIIGLLNMANSKDLPIKCLQTSHKSIEPLSDPLQVVPWRNRRSWKELLAKWPNVSFVKINPRMNSVANIIAYHGSTGSTPSPNAQPPAAKVALAGMNLPFLYDD